MSLIMPMRVTAETASAVTNLDKVSAAERRVGAEARAAGREMQQGFGAGKAATKDLLSTVENLQQGMFRVTAAFGVTAVITQFTRGIVDSSNKMQGWRQAFNAATGSIVKGAGELEFARQEAERLGISLETSTYSFAKLTAATRGTVLAGEATRDIFTAVAEASRVLNLGAEQTTGAFRAIEQMVSKGNVQAEELRGQLAERIPGAFQLTANAMGVTTEALNGMLERGEVLAVDMLPKLADELKKLYSGAAADAANTPAASFARLGNAILELQVAIGDAGFMKILADGAIELTEALNDLVDSGALSTIVEGLLLLGQAVVLAFAGKGVAAIGTYISDMVKGLAVTSALAEQEMLMTKATLDSAEALVFYSKERLAAVEADRLAIAQKLRAAEVDKLAAMATLDATKNSATLSGIIRVRAEATEQLAIAEAKLVALNAEASAAAKLRALAETQLSGALAAQATAQAGLTATMSTGMIIMTRLRAMAASLFAMIGGWAGVAVIAAYAVYQLWAAIREGEEAIRAPITAIEELNEALTERLRIQDLIASGKATTDTVEQATALGALTKSVQSANQQLEVARFQLENFGTAGDRATVAMKNGLIRQIETLEERVQTSNSVLQEFLTKSIMLGDKLPPEYQKIADAARRVEEQIKRWIPAFDDAAKTADRVSEAESKFSDSLVEKAEKLRIANVEQRKGVEAALIYEAALKRSKELHISVEDAMASLSAETLANAKTVGQLTKENEALVEAEKARDRATRDSEKTERKRAEALEQQVAAQQKVLDMIDDMASEIEGPMKKAENEWAKRNREIINKTQIQIERARQLGGAQADLTKIYLNQNQALELSADLYAQEAQAIQDAIDERNALGSVVDIGVSDLEQEVKLLQMSELEREILNATLAAEKQARQDVEDKIRIGIALTEEEIRAIRDRITAASETKRIVVANNEAAEQYQQTWKQAVEGVSNVMADFIVGNIKSFKDFGKALVDIIKRAVAEMIANFLKMKVIGPMLNGIMGGVGGSVTGSMTGAVAGQAQSGILNNMFGGAGTGSSLTSIAGALPGLLAIGGIVAGFRNPGNNALATAGRVGAYGVAGWAAGTVASGALLGGAAAAAGAGAAGVGVAGAAASGAATGAMGAAAAVPVIGWIIAAIAAIDMITGGKVFGTKYRPESTRESIAINSQGGTATAQMTEVRQRALFGGRSWRTTNLPASAEAREAATALFDAVKNTMIDSARRLEIEVPPVINAAIRTVTEYDKKGKVKTSQIFVDILGRSFKEADPEKAGMRIIAESIIAVLAKSVNSQVSLAKPAIDTAFAKIFALDEDGLPDGGGRRGGGGGSGGGIAAANAALGEVHVIAERWRKDAELLLEGAQFLLLAQEQIVKGNNLFDGASLTRITNLVEEMQRGEETMSQTFARLLAATDLLEMALERTGVTIEATGEDFVRFASEFVDAAGGMEAAAALWDDYLAGFFNIEEQAQLALQQAEEFKTRLMTGIGLDPDTTAAEFRTAFEAALPTLEPEELVRWLEASRALQAVDNALAVIAQQAYELAQFTQSIADAVFDQEATDFERAVMQIRRATANYITDANALARSRGQEGASARDLALIHRFAANEFRKAILALEDSIRDLVDQLGYGPLATIEAQIAALEASLNIEGQTSGLEDVGQAAEDLFSQWEDGIRSLQDYVQGLLVGELSPLTPEQRLNEAQSQLDTAIAGAQGGDLDALNSIPQLADQFFRMLQQWEASGMDYSGVVQQYLDQFNNLGVNPFSPLSPDGPSVPTTTTLVPSDELIALYAERDRITTEAEAAHRLALAMDLAERLTELVRNNGETLFAAAERLGVNFTQLVTDLGGSVTASTADQITTLGDIANMLNIELPEMADRIGLSLGELTDTQSLLNDAFELQLATIPTEFRDVLEPLFRDVETASSPEETNAALDALNEATNDLPEELRLALAPYLAGVDPITPDLASELDYLSDMWTELQSANIMLGNIRDQLIISNGGVIAKNGEPTPNSVNSKLMFAGDLLNTVKSASTEANSAMVYEMQQMRAEQERLRAELKAALERLGDTNEKATREGADKVASSVDDIKRNGIVARTG